MNNLYEHEYSKKYDKKVKSELQLQGLKIHNERIEGDKIYMWLEKFPNYTKTLLKTDLGSL